jgi:enamine deaminase RidA (YjgF/YER057c/UK114 family)
MRTLAAAPILLALILSVPPVAVLAQEAPTYPLRLPSSGGEVIIPSQGGRYAHDTVGYAPARRAGDTLYVSGAIVFRGEGEGTDLAAFEAQVRRTLTSLNRTLEAAGVSMDDVAMVNSFHVWEGPDFAARATNRSRSSPGSGVSSRTGRGRRGQRWARRGCWGRVGSSRSS